jgi:hypothetical protein
MQPQKATKPLFLARKFSATFLVPYTKKGAKTTWWVGRWWRLINKNFRIYANSIMWSLNYVTVEIETKL